MNTQEKRINELANEIIEMDKAVELNTPQHKAALKEAAALAKKYGTYLTDQFMDTIAVYVGSKGK